MGNQPTHRWIEPQPAPTEPVEIQSIYDQHRGGLYSQIVTCLALVGYVRIYMNNVPPPSPVQVELIRRDYVANGGWETFLSYEDPEQDILIGLLRLRKCSPESFRPELKGGVSIVRELHVYGSVVPISSRDPSKFQHQVSGEQSLCVAVMIEGGP